MIKKIIKEIAESVIFILIVVHHFLWSLATKDYRKYFNLAGYTVSSILIIDLVLWIILGCFVLVRIINIIENNDK